MRSYLIFESEEGLCPGKRWDGREGGRREKSEGLAPGRPKMLIGTLKVEIIQKIFFFPISLLMLFLFFRELLGTSNLFSF